MSKKKTSPAPTTSLTPSLPKQIISTESTLKDSLSSNKMTNLEKLIQMQQRYEYGDRDELFMMQYIEMLKKNNQPFAFPMQELLDNKTIENSSSTLIQFIFDFSDGVETDAMRFFVKNLTYFKEKYGYQEINNKLKTALEKSIKNAFVENESEILYERCMEVIDYVEMESKLLFKFKIQSIYYLGRNKWEEYTEIAKKYIETHRVSDPILLNEAARNYQLYINDRKKLGDALKWIDEAVKYANEYEYNLTYAKLAKKLEKYEMAKYRVLLAIEIAKVRGINHHEADILNDNLPNVLPKK